MTQGPTPVRRGGLGRGGGLEVAEVGTRAFCLRWVGGRGVGVGLEARSKGHGGLLVCPRGWGVSGEPVWWGLWGASSRPPGFSPSPPFGTLCALKKTLKLLGTNSGLLGGKGPRVWTRVR